MMFGNHNRYNNRSMIENRMVKRHIKFIAAKAKEASDGGKAAARRRKQMLKGSLKPDNGVVKAYACDNAQCKNVVTAPGLCHHCTMLANAAV